VGGAAPPPRHGGGGSTLIVLYATDSLSVRYGTVRTGQPRDAAQPGMAAAAESNRLDLLLSQFWTAN